MKPPGDFATGLILVAAVVWLFMTPLIAVSALVEFCVWRRRRAAGRLCAKQHNRGEN